MEALLFFIHVKSLCRCLCKKKNTFVNTWFTKVFLKRMRSEADSNRCSSFCRAVPSHSAIRPYHPFGSANIQTFSFFTKFLPFFHRKVKISSLSHAKTSYRELILEHKYTHNTPYIGFLKKKRNFTLRKKAKRCTSKILRWPWPRGWVWRG